VKVQKRAPLERAGFFRYEPPRPHHSREKGERALLSAVRQPKGKGHQPSGREKNHYLGKTRWEEAVSSRAITIPIRKSPGGTVPLFINEGK